jgi:pyruvate formate lyase activating enzyme
VLFDFKRMDPTLHEKYTGVSNKLILENARHIYHDMSIPLLARVPVICGFNDSVENITATARFISNELSTSVKVHLLPYHRLGETKYERLEKPANPIHIEVPDEQHMQKLKGIFESFGLAVQIGG